MNMNDYNIFFVLIIEVIRILITRKFALVFLDSSENKIKTLTAYISSVILTGSAYYISNISWLNLLCTFLGLTFISLAHRGSIKERVLFVLCVLSLSCIVDLIVYSLFGKTYAFTNYYEISNIVDLIFLLAAQVFTKKFIDKNRYNEMESRDLYKYVVSLIVCVATSLVIITDNSISSVSLLIVCGSFLIINLIMIFLLDDTIRANVAFGIEEKEIVDDAREELAKLEFLTIYMTKNADELSFLLFGEITEPRGICRHFRLSPQFQSSTCALSFEI